MLRLLTLEPRPPLELGALRRFAPPLPGGRRKFLRCLATCLYASMSVPFRSGSVRGLLLAILMIGPVQVQGGDPPRQARTINSG